MNIDINDIFNSITPDNIKSLPVVRDAMTIFIETLKDLSSESIDIRNIYTNDVIKEELVKIYLDDLYQVFKTLQFNQKVVDKIERINAIYGTQYYKTDVILNITKYINEEHFLAFRSFKEKKGTAAGIQYIYELVGTKILSENAQMPFTLTENGTFDFSVQGSLPRELYDALVSPLANPLGFRHVYDQVISLALEDIFLSTGFYSINVLEVRCLLPDGTTVATDYKYDNGVLRVITDVRTEQDSQTRTKKIFFDDGTYLKQVTTLVGQTTVEYMAADDTTVLWSSPYQCSIYFDYNYELTTGVQEEFSTAVNSALSDTSDLPTESESEIHIYNAFQNQLITDYINYTPWYEIGQEFNTGETTYDVYIGKPLGWSPSNPTGAFGQDFFICNDYWINWVLGYDSTDNILIGTSNTYIGTDYSYTQTAPDGESISRILTYTYGDADPVNISTTVTDNFDFGVYRSGVLLTDNNVSMWV